MKILKKVRTEFLIAATIAVTISALSSAITYQIVIRRVPQIAVVDLIDLQNQFSIDIARYLLDHNVGDEKMAEVVKGLCNKILCPTQILPYPYSSNLSQNNWLI